MRCTYHAAGLLIFRHAVVEYSMMQGEDRQRPGDLRSLDGRVSLLVGSE